MATRRIKKESGLLIIVAIVACASQVSRAQGAPAAKPSLPDVVTFNAHIRPIMSKTCFVCHGPDEAANSSGYRIDSFDAATRSLTSDNTLHGIVPGNAEESEVYRRIMGTSDGESMPPTDFRHKLTDFDKALFRRWIDQGAKYQVHWSYTRVERPTVPNVSLNGKAVANPIDAFIIHRLQRDSIQPGPLADKRTLLRRLSLDLTGLPPTPEEVEAFVDDNAEDAYVQQVERLMRSKHFGERMASQWLDLVRFSDTVGFHGDQNQNIYPYRDYVIESLNDNKPFDQFTREQLAGDLLPDPTAEQLAATGLIRMNMMTREGGSQPEEYLAKYTADRVRLIGTAWLGATTGCCECHNHKFDPYTIRDFYSLGAFFDDIRQWGVYADYDYKPNDYTPNPDLDGFGNHHPFPPEMRMKSRSTMEQLLWLEQDAEIAIAKQVDATTRQSNAFRQWSSHLGDLLREYSDGWIPAEVEEVSSTSNTTFVVKDDGSVLLSGEPAKDDLIAVSVGVRSALPINAIRLEVLPDEVNRGFVGRGRDGRFSVDVSVQKNSAISQTLKIAWAQADRQRPAKYENGRIPAYLNGVWQSGPEVWQLPKNEASLPHTAVYHLQQPITIALSDRLQFQLKSADVGRVRISVSPLVRAVAGMPAASDRLIATCTTASVSDAADAVAAAYYLSTTPKSEYKGDIGRRLGEIGNLHSGYAMVMVADAVPDKSRRVSRVLLRGNWQDKSGPAVDPATPAFLPQPKLTSQRRLNRLDLSNWLTTPENPLTPRHWVNRTWKSLFGTGLSARLDDLGSQGEWPSHVELLDWLAAEFIDSGWDQKHMIRLIVKSRTYRQAAASRRDLLEIDPYNRLLAQQSPRRLEAESIRDNALAIAGLLSTELVGGPSVLPYQPAGHWSIMAPPGRPYNTSSGIFQYRRGVYMHWQRTFLHPMLTNFDAPMRDECTADRPISNSPQQALTLLNDPSFVEASIALADKVLAGHSDMTIDTFIDTCIERALARPATDEERQSLSRLATQQLEYFAVHLDDAKSFVKAFQYQPVADVDPATLAAWSQVCRVILNSHETITRY